MQRNPATPSVAAEATRVCAGCGRMRGPAPGEPAWRCPHCHVAYHKVAARLARMASAAPAPRPGDSAVLGRWWTDQSLWVLVAANLWALWLARADGWSVTELMFLYWCQSVIIGLGQALRMAALRAFTTEGFTSNGEPVPETAAGKYSTVLFFLMHYGIFHGAYLAFVLGQGAAITGPIALGTAVLAFAVHHLFSLRYNIEVDRRGRPNLGNLMFTPYLRIVPMHLTIILGGAIGIESPGALLLFGLLKLGADVGMHLVEHHRYQGKASAA